MVIMRTWNMIPSIFLIENDFEAFAQNSDNYHKKM
jgi:hypothetical protein